MYLILLSAVKRRDFREFTSTCKVFICDLRAATDRLWCAWAGEAIPSTTKIDRTRDTFFIPTTSPRCPFRQLLSRIGRYVATTMFHVEHMFALEQGSLDGV